MLSRYPHPDPLLYLNQSLQPTSDHVTCVVTCCQKLDNGQLAKQTWALFIRPKFKKFFGTGANGTEIFRQKFPEYQKCVKVPNRVPFDETFRKFLVGDRMERKLSEILIWGLFREFVHKFRKILENTALFVTWNTQNF